MTVTRSSAGCVCGGRRAPAGSLRRIVKKLGFFGSPSSTATFAPAGSAGPPSFQAMSPALSRTTGDTLAAGAADPADDVVDVGVGWDPPHEIASAAKSTPFRTARIAATISRPKTSARPARGFRLVIVDRCYA